MSALSLLPLLAGLALGLRHAFEPDHLAAVSTLASEQRSVRGALAIGLSWGLGHAATLLALGGALCLAELSLDARAALALEALVGIAIAVLGARAVLRAAVAARTGPRLPHAHGAGVHTHPAAGHHFHFWGISLATRPLLFGALHGLAGSGALAALLMLELHGVLARLIYLGLFGLGAALSMSLLTAAAGFPLRALAASPRAAAAVSAAAGALSLIVGLAWAGSATLGLLA